MSGISYSPDVYKDEKAQGIRLSNGAKPLAKLSPKHLDILRLHLQGMKSCDIATIHHCTDSTVSLTLSDPRMVEMKKQHKQNVSNEFDALYSNTVDVLRDGMSVSQPMNIRLKSADMFLKEAPSQKTAELERETAEDVVQRLLQVAVQVNVGTTPLDQGKSISGEVKMSGVARIQSAQTDVGGEAVGHIIEDK